MITTKKYIWFITWKTKAFIPTTSHDVTTNLILPSLCMYISSNNHKKTRNVQIKQEAELSFFLQMLHTTLKHYCTTLTTLH